MEESKKGFTNLICNRVLRFYENLYLGFVAENSLKLLLHFPLILNNKSLELEDVSKWKPIEATVNLGELMLYHHSTVDL